MSINKLENWRKLDFLEDDKRLVYRRLYPLLQQSDELGMYRAIGLPNKLYSRTIKEVTNFRAAVTRLLEAHLAREVGEEETDKRVLIHGIIDNIAALDKIIADIKRIEADPDADYPDIEVGRRAA